MLACRMGAAVLATWVCLCAVADEPARLDPFHLLEFRDADGVVRPVATADDWHQRRAEVVAGMQAVMGELPGRDALVPLEPLVVEEADAGRYVRRLITYQSAAGARTPAYLCVPKDVADGTRRAAAVLCLHPTDNEAGHRVVVGLGGRAHRQYAAELAERGYVTIAPSYPHLANYWPNLAELGFDSGTMKAIWDNLRAVDLLASLPGVDMSRGVAAIGHSLGGHNAIFTAVFDPRITVVVTSCGFDSFLDYYAGAERNWYFGQGWCQIRYMPRLSNYRGRLEQIPFDFPELLGALAPRPVYVNAPQHDDNFQVASVDRCVAAAQPVYALLGGSGRLRVEHPDCDHDFPDAQREQAYQFIDAVLTPQEAGRGEAPPR